MKLDCILTSCNTNPLYMDFIPIFIKTWNKLYPIVDVKIVLISNTIPTEFHEFTKNIILFPPLEDISTAFTSQYIRLLYPAILNYENGIMITDIDMLPMNRTYYTSNIQNVENDKFIYMRNVLLQNKQIAMCYNVARNKTWGEIFSIITTEDINNHLKEAYSQITYVDGHNQAGWSTDQTVFYKKIMRWNDITNNFIVLNDNKTGYRRLNRNTFTMNTTMRNQVKSGYYSDYHCYRPYMKYKEINDQILDLL